jgi:pentatricopeptide repeat protein
VVTWYALILGHVKCRQGWEALKIFQQMQHEGVQPDSHTFVRLLNAYASIFSCEEGRCAHKQIIQSGWESDVFGLGNEGGSPF